MYKRRRLFKIIGLICLLSGCTNNEVLIQPDNIEVIKDVKEDDTYNYLNQYLDSFIFSKKELLSKVDGNDISWEIVEGDAYITDDNYIIKTDTADEYEDVVLKAVVNECSYTFDNIVLLDEYFANLITYFSGDGDDTESLKLAMTYDGNLWYEINDQKSVLKPTTGTKRLRDPSVVRNKDGGFYVLATQGYDTNAIYVWDTKDFVNFENERLLQVNKSSSSLPMKQQQAWAPEGFYDRMIDKYFIYWSSPSDGGMYYNYTNDFYDVSYPKQLLDVGFPVIDGTIFKQGYDYNIILKDERQPMEEYSRLFVGYSDSDYLNINHFNYDYITGHQSEGPFVIFRGPNYILYYDDYTRFQFKALYFKNFRKHDFEIVPDEEIISSVTNLKHASAIPITWKEYLRFAKTYGMEE